MRQPVGVGHEARIGNQFGTLQHVGAQAFPGALVGGPDHDEAHAGVARLIRRGHPVPAARAFRHRAVGEVGGGLPHEPRQSAFRQRDVDVLAFARLHLMAMPDCNGLPPASPVMLMMPLMPCATRSKPPLPA
ncbi:hypothetical protein G6F57_022423 [Rhizopus arrhizus]|nr:hypothetical protein G6F57_022423 [Rhizopus arrhizus]